MKTTSFLLGILLVVGAHEVRQTSATDQLLQTLNLTNCDRLTLREACAERKFRTFDGTCNNLCNTTRGAANRPLRRLLPNAYQQPDNQPRSQSVISGKALSNARTISRAVFTVNNTADINGTAPDFTHLTMTWGQFLDHDMTLTELTQGVECGINNQPCPQNPDCTGIDIPKGLELEFNQSAQCIPLPRSFRDDFAEQVNIITSYIDGSQVYGSDSEFARLVILSKKGHGLLDVRIVESSGDRPRLPPSNPEAFCRSPDRGTADCFVAGDVRVNENHALMAMHTLWVREHNRIATNLHALNPHWCDERLFQEARRIVIAELQHITYNEWLAVLFSEDLRRSEGILLEPDGKFFTGYDPTVNPEMLNCFSTAALRMGHTLIRNVFNLISPCGRRVGFLLVRDFFNPIAFFNQGGINIYGGIMRGLTGIRARNVDHFFTKAVGERLIIEGPTIDGIVGDLPAINIQRARDHGLPGYTAYREALGGGPANFFSDLRNTIPQERINVLKSVYAAVKDIDLFAGALQEFPLKGSVFGLTFTKILTQQFRESRSGDRFWYERDDPEIGFTKEQLAEIRKSSVARVICDNTDGVNFIQPKAFKPRTSRSGGNPFIRCRSLDFVNLKVFREEPGASMGGEASGPVSA